MNLDFDLAHVVATEFGVGRDLGGEQAFQVIPVDAEVQAAIREMVLATREAMQAGEEDLRQYQPSEKHAGVEYVYLPLAHQLAVLMRNLHQAENLPLDAAALTDSDSIYSYFARLTDGDGRRLTALRRATQFKGVLKSRLIRLVNDALTLVEDRVFKLDNDFDLLIDSMNVHILRPSSFEFVGDLQQAILAAVPDNVKAIQADLKFVDFGPIEEYAGTHPRAARYLASIRSQKEAKNIDKSALKRLCKETGVDVELANGRLTVREGHMMGFLEVLDRRRYEVELVKGTPERFKAASRQRLK